MIGKANFTVLTYTLDNARDEAVKAARRHGGRWAVIKGLYGGYDFDKDDGSNWIKSRAVEYVKIEWKDVR